jgi:hypothetical protein
MNDLSAEAETEAMELMTGGFLGDGIGPGNTAKRINAKYGTSITGEEMWRLWKSYIDPPAEEKET